MNPIKCLHCGKDIVEKKDPNEEAFNAGADVLQKIVDKKLLKTYGNIIHKKIVKMQQIPAFDKMLDHLNDIPLSIKKKILIEIDRLIIVYGHNVDIVLKKLNSYIDSNLKDWIS